ncbi:hypothetical protein IIA79_03055 [bacterium]|nr:hypothetical protein [bacterium]
MGFFIELFLGIAILVVASAWARSFFNRGKARAAKLEQVQHDKDRTTYERIVKEKLEVIKTALTMGYGENDLERLDARLENLIGREKLESLHEHGEIPIIHADLADTDLLKEIERLQKTKTGQ